jgi:hypothetical protein
MNAYPRLSERAYEDKEIHHEEVVAMIADVGADMWRYYKSKRLTEEQQEQLKKTLAELMRYW